MPNTNPTTKTKQTVGGKEKRKNYLLMLREIDDMLENDWAFNVIDCKHNFKDGGYNKFSQKEAEEMSQVLGKIYLIAHGIHCACGDKYRRNIHE